LIITRTTRHLHTKTAVQTKISNKPNKEKKSRRIKAEMNSEKKNPIRNTKFVVYMTRHITIE
jgi:hypothetical protein